MSTKIVTPGLYDCLIQLHLNGHLNKAHSFDIRTVRHPDLYTTFFVVPDYQSNNRFKIEVTGVLPGGGDASLVAELQETEEVDKYVLNIANIGLASPPDIQRVLKGFLLANSFFEAKKSDVQPDSLLPYPDDSTWETAAKRPIPGSNIHDLFEFLEGMIKTRVDHRGTSSLEKLFVDNWRKELEWHINRWGVFEHGLIKLAQGLSTPDLMKVLDERSDILYYLFDNKEVSNEEIKEVLRQCNKPRLTDRIYFQVPRDYKPGDSLKIMGSAISAIQEYERNFKPVVPEPDMISYDAADPTIRWVNPLWLEWCEDNRISLDNALQKTYDAVTASFPGRNVKVDLQRNTDTNIHYIVVTEKVRI